MPSADTKLLSKAQWEEAPEGKLKKLNPATTGTAIMLRKPQQGCTRTQHKLPLCADKKKGKG